MSAQPQTLQLIRQITSDGIVTFTELTNLATFLNENREARKNWPGTALFDVLGDILKDGRVDKHELDGLNLILEGIEIICAGNVAEELALEPASAPEPAEAETVALVENLDEVDPLDATPTVMLDLPPATDLKLPEIAAVDVAHGYEGVNLIDYTCKCDDWLNVRKKLSPNSPGRACRCIVDALASEIAEGGKISKQFGEVFAEVIRVANSSGRGLEAVETWKLLNLAGKKFVISKGTTLWCNLYATGFEGMMEKFSYNRGYKRWGFGAFPKDQDLLKEFFDSGFERVFGTEKS